MRFEYIIVEDNALDRLSLKAHLKPFNDFVSIGEYASAEEALIPIKEKKPSILFLDIDMGKMNGITLRSLLPEIPVCIFISSHLDYAFEGFEQNALDFLSKPIKKERFQSTLDRIRDYLKLKEKAVFLDNTIGKEFIYIKDGQQKIKLNMHEILFLEAFKDYTKIVTSNKAHFVLSSLHSLLLENSFASFIRVHRSFAVPKHVITAIKSNEIIINQYVIPVGRTYKNNLHNL
jgi:two-component system LytT family response regulator